MDYATNKDEFPFNSKKDSRKVFKTKKLILTLVGTDKKTKGYEKIGKRLLNLKCY